MHITPLGVVIETRGATPCVLIFFGRIPTKNGEYLATIDTYLKFQMVEYMIHRAALSDQGQQAPDPGAAGQQGEEGESGHEDGGGVQQADRLGVLGLTNGFSRIADKGLVHQAAEVGAGPAQAHP